MRTRKTIEVKKLRDKMNNILALEQMSKGTKITLCVLLEDILMETGNYRGFKWNLPYEEAKAVMPEDEKYYDRTYF